MLIRIISITVCICAVFISYSQTGYISDGAFRKMMEDHYRFTIVGSQTPVSGLKVETANPSITLKGNVLSSKSRSRILNLELQGGLSDGVMQLFSGQKTSAYFKGTLGLNFLSKDNVGYYNQLSTTERSMTAHALTNSQKKLSTQMDSFYVIRIITDHQGFHNTTFNLQMFVSELYDSTIQNNRQLTGFTRSTYRTRAAWDTYFEQLILAMLKKYGADSMLNGDNRLADFRSKVLNVNDETIKTKAILEDYDRLYEILIKEEQTFQDRQHDIEIALTKFNWNRVRIGWFNVSAIAGNSRFWLYNSGKQNVIDTNSFTGGLSLSYNLFYKYKEPHRYIFLRGGVMLHKMHNLPDLTKFSYKQETVITAPPGTLTDKKEGTAYQGTLTEKWGTDIFAEIYYAQWRNSALPGIYIKPVLRNNQGWINPTQLSADLGIIWSINSTDKDAKNLLTIIPYVSWSNVLTGYKDATKTDKRHASDNFSFNVKFGVPFNLGK